MNGHIRNSVQKPARTGEAGGSYSATDSDPSGPQRTTQGPFGPSLPVCSTPSPEEHERRALYTLLLEARRERDEVRAAARHLLAAVAPTPIGQRARVRAAAAGLHAALANHPTEEKPR
jgi:hypothetical protein